MKLSAFISTILLAAVSCQANSDTSNQPGGNTMSGSDFRQAYVDGKSAADIAREAIERINAWDERFNAVIVAGGDGMNESVRVLDSLTSAERKQLPLAGVPILVKDNIETREWPTTAGSLALADNMTGRDAALITLLRKAGALVVGKANLSEWANFRSEQSISGWSGVGGQVRNAHDPTRSPCGSSSGSAVAVALGYVPVAIGSETDGSIICPASVNGVVGFKPTHGLVSGEGVIPLAASQDTAGPITATVRDAADTLAAMIDPEHEQAAAVRQALLADQPADLKDIRIGILANTQGFDKRRDQLLDKALAVLKELKGTLVPDLHTSPYDGFNQDEYTVLLYEFGQQLDAYLAARPNGDEALTLEQIIEFNAASDVELSLFDQSIFIKTRDLVLTEDQYQEKLARIKQAARQDGLDLLFEEKSLDVLVGITVGPAWTIDDINGDAFHGPSMSSLPAVGGHPHITVPMGDIKGMPVGLSFVGRRYADGHIAGIARAFEKASTGNKKSH